MNEKALEHAQDLIGEELSECCGSPMSLVDDGVGLCTSCKEWSGTLEDEEPEEPHSASIIGIVNNIKNLADEIKKQ
jgi:hypothetical protein